MPASRITVLLDPEERRRRFVEDVRAGLTSTPKSLPPKYFYDARGSELFERITELEEYYPTRCETSILERRAASLVEAAGPAELVELGSGSSSKTRLLIDALRAAGGSRYVALDTSAAAIEGAQAALAADYPGLSLEGFVADFEDLGAVARALPRRGRRLMLFLGSTIGNFTRPERAEFLRSVRAILGPEDSFLIGVDLVKEVDTLERAYDDADGVTAEFNLNVLEVLSRELGGELHADDFEHVSFFDRANERIEMWLRARRAVDARLDVLDLSVHFDPGEEMRTEISCKFTRAGVEAELNEAGYELTRWDTDERGWFGLALAQPAALA
jgi:L-histidine N-alpha-methyltransferase